MGTGGCGGGATGGEGRPKGSGDKIHRGQADEGRVREAVVLMKVLV